MAEGNSLLNCRGCEPFVSSNLTVSSSSYTKEKVVAKPKQTASERDRTLSGQWTKTEKRAEASRQIMASKKRTHEINKAFKNNQFLSK